mmetsp:Transcript_31157/g.37704  ORF Transcript_31157/g.37704 Transcript_31157/m.37704 type:complete len:82 (+) Transcript_31157:467-712(+)
MVSSTQSAPHPLLGCTPITLGWTSALCLTSVTWIEATRCSKRVAWCNNHGRAPGYMPYLLCSVAANLSYPPLMYHTLTHHH